MHSDYYSGRKRATNSLLCFVMIVFHVSFPGIYIAYKRDVNHKLCDRSVDNFKNKSWAFLYDLLESNNINSLLSSEDLT